MVHYLIEFRFHGKAKYSIKGIAIDLYHKFHIRTEQHPHITLTGPFTTHDEKKLIGDFNRACSASNLMRFSISGFSFFEDARTVYVDIKPDEHLGMFRWNLSQQLGGYCVLTDFDKNRDFKFHATISNHVPLHKFERIKDYVTTLQTPKFQHVMVRATLLKGGIILREYDFLLRRPLVRRLALNKHIYAKTINLLEGHLTGNYDANESIKEDVNVPKPGFLNKLKRSFTKPRIFFTSDLHLDHENIIKYCHRPFLNVEDMNRTLVNNWNNTIEKNDRVYFLGDMSFGKGSRSADHWLSKLNGDIYFIRGFSYNVSGERNQHDKISRTKNVFDSLIIEHNGRKFYLVHDPANIPSDWKDWAICGHHHNNKLDEYPFIDKKNKRINVSTELTKFRPIDIDMLIGEIED
jgi:calcineurin-like phosphoesterase family protein